ncbi:MAG TPA: ester cyclase, partial [Thermomicrobiales bacterium]|nr:ester cyclase [Thermomicrobiales bacterium]
MRNLLAPFRWFLHSGIVRSLRFRLILTVLLASLPTLLLLFLTASQQRAEALEFGQQEAERLARTAAADQGREMDRVQRELALLTRLPEVQSHDPSPCTGFFQGLVIDPDNAIYVDLRVLTEDGEVFCRSTGASPLRQNEDLGFIEDAFDGTEFTVGPYRVNPANGNAIISFAAPVRDDDGTIERVVVATLDLGSQSTFMTQSTLPEGAVIQLVDEQGTLLLQRPPQRDVLGASLRGTPVVDEAIGIAATPVPGGGDDGDDGDEVMVEDDYITATQPITITSTDSVAGNASVIVLVPEEAIVRGANDAFRDNLGKLGVATAVVIFAAWISADLFVARDGETRKSIVAELYHAYSSGAVEHLDGIVAADFTDHSPAPGQSKGIDGLKQSVAAFRTAFPDGEIVPREMLADRDKVVARVSLTGTHLAEFQGVPPSGKRMIADGTET